MPCLQVRDVRIHYEVLESQLEHGELETVVITLGGRSGINAAKTLGDSLISRVRGIRVLLWDRRNTNNSGMSYPDKPLIPEDAEDLKALLDKLAFSKSKQVVLYGCSSGSRVSLIFAVKWPQLVRGLILAPPTGSDAIEELCEMYYEAPSALARGKGLSTVAIQNFKDLSDRSRSEFVGVPIDAFLSANELTKQWMDQFRGQTLIGVTDDQLKELTKESIKMLLIHDGNPDDKLHTPRAIMGMARLIRAKKIHLIRGIFNLPVEACAHITALLQDEFWPNTLGKSKL